MAHSSKGSIMPRCGRQNDVSDGGFGGVVGIGFPVAFRVKPTFSLLFLDLAEWPLMAG
jgi:hypothetical protein